MQHEETLKEMENEKAKINEETDNIIKKEMTEATRKLEFINTQCISLITDVRESMEKVTSRFIKIIMSKALF